MIKTLKEATLPISMPNCVIIDMDNTLYPYDPAHEVASEAVKTKVIKSFGLSEDIFEGAYKKAREQTKLQLKHTAASHSRLLYMQKMMENLGLGSQVLFSLDLEQTYWRTFLANVQLFPGAKDFLDDLRLNNIPSVIVTDLTAQVQFRKMVYFGIDHFFDYIVTSEEAGHDKPHEDMFRLGLQKTNPKGDIVWMVGDNPKNDIAGAKNAVNAVTFQKIHSGVNLGTGEEAPDYSFDHFVDLRNLLKQLK